MEATLLLILVTIFFLAAALGLGVGLFFLFRYMNPDPSPVDVRLKRLKEQQSDVQVNMQEVAADIAIGYFANDVHRCVHRFWA